MGGDGPLILNAILVVVERFSALKRARFGSETSAAALRGMCVLLCLSGGSEEEAEDRTGAIQSGVPQEDGPIAQGEIGNMLRHLHHLTILLRTALYRNLHLLTSSIMVKSVQAMAAAPAAHLGYSCDGYLLHVPAAGGRYRR